MDADNDPDVLATSFLTDSVIWYEAPGWTKHPMQIPFNGAYSVMGTDIDGDNEKDILATGYVDGWVGYFKAPFWSFIPVGFQLDGAMGVDVGDINGDSQPDIVATGNIANDVVWYEAPFWTKHYIDLNLVGAHNVSVEDMDADNDLDVVVTADFADSVVWYANQGGTPVGWEQKVIDDDLRGAMGLYITDLDGDSDPDVLATGYDDLPHIPIDVVWYKNETTSWGQNIVAHRLKGATAVSAADMNNDTFLDVVATGRTLGELVWYEAPFWTEHFIDLDLDSAYGLYIADMDGDNDLDVVATGFAADDVVWYENNLLRISSQMGGNEHLNLPIEDNQTTTNSIFINVSETMPQSYILVGVEVVIDTVLHTADGDLEFTITHDGKTDSLIYRKGGNGDNFFNTILTDLASIPIDSGSAPFSGNYRPYHPLSKFNGLDPNGEWTLSIYDGVPGNTGSLEAWSLRLSYEIVTGIEPQTTSVPTEYQLFQNYPNPFNPVTNISFQLPHSGKVRIDIYNILGQRVATVIDRYLPGGSYRYPWKPQTLASGVYIYRLQSENYSSVKKMIFMK
jgi:subtilisin-like proprotein convertase family protein